LRREANFGQETRYCRGGDDNGAVGPSRHVHDRARLRLPAGAGVGAFADPVAKRRWFAEGDGWTIEAFDVDFRVGGFERSRFRFLDGPLVTNDTVYQDIVPDERIIIAYAMTVAEKPISCSLATIEFKPQGKGTRLVYTEQGAFLDKLDQAADRERGCAGLLIALEKEIVGGEARA
jgi:uncharacterized protein YndB with AHSA1/START domain